MRTLTQTTLLFVTLCVGALSVQATTQVDDLNVHRGFDYATERLVLVQLEVLDHDGYPAANRMIEVLTPGNGTNVIERAATDDLGLFEAIVSVPGHLKTVLIRTNVFGIANEAELRIDADAVHHRFQ